MVVLSLADTGQTKLPAMELLLGAGSGKFPVGWPQPDHDIDAAAEHRMNLALRHLRTIGCRASGLISDEVLVKAVRTGDPVARYDEVILATGRQDARLAQLTGQGSGSATAAQVGPAAQPYSTRAIPKGHRASRPVQRQRGATADGCAGSW